MCWARRLAAVFALFTAFAAVHAQAAEVQVLTDHKYCHAVLRGVIEKGDAEKVQRVYSADNIDWEKRVLCLDSPGGSYPEAVRIMRLLMSNLDGEETYNWIGTRIDAGMSCQYACAIVFLGGSYNVGEMQFGPDRKLHEDGILAFGIPPLEQATGSVSRSDLEQAYEESILTMADLLSIYLLNASNGFIPYRFLSRVLASKEGELVRIEMGTDLEAMQIAYVRNSGSCWMYLWNNSKGIHEYREEPTCNMNAE